MTRFKGVEGEGKFGICTVRRNPIVDVFEEKRSKRTIVNAQWLHSSVSMTVTYPAQKRYGLERISKRVAAPLAKGPALDAELVSAARWDERRRDTQGVGGLKWPQRAGRFVCQHVAVCVSCFVF